MSDTSPKIDSVQVSASAVVEPPLVILTKQDNTKPTETKVDTSKPLAVITYNILIRKNLIKFKNKKG